MPTLAFFGATGGCASTALIDALNAGHDCSALVRTPSKLTALLLSKSVPQETLDAHLTIVEGNVKDTTAVEMALITKDGTVRSAIIFGVGGTPKFTNPLKPTIDDPTVCQSGISSVISALSTLRTALAARYSTPLLLAISTTGVSAKRDIPLAMVPLYKWILAVPRGDKKAMEDAIEGVEEGLLRGWVILRPAMLTDGPRKGAAKVRAGYEGRKKTGASDQRWGDITGTVVGYSISRADVGGFIFEEFVERDGGEWLGKKVTLVG